MLEKAKGEKKKKKRANRRQTLEMILRLREGESKEKEEGTTQFSEHQTRGRLVPQAWARKGKTLVRSLKGDDAGLRIDRCIGKCRRGLIKIVKHLECSRGGMKGQQKKKEGAGTQDKSN